MTLSDAIVAALEDRNASARELVTLTGASISGVQVVINKLLSRGMLVEVARVRGPMRRQIAIYGLASKTGCAALLAAWPMPSARDVE